MRFKCLKCGKEFDAAYKAVWICPKCGAMDGDIKPIFPHRIPEAKHEQVACQIVINGG